LRLNISHREKKDAPVFKRKLIHQETYGRADPFFRINCEEKYMVDRTGSSNVCRPTPTYAKQLFVAPLALLLVFSAANGQDPATVGQWSARTTWPYKAVHAALLPTGKVLWWPQGANGDNPYLWNPATNTNTAIAHVGANIFCAGFSFLADGTLLVAGGHINNFVGLPNAYIYNPFNSTWTRLPDMNNGRWYPTSTTLPSGNVLVVSGWINTSIGVNVEPQVWPDCDKLLAQSQFGTFSPALLSIHVCSAQWQGILRRPKPD
jgi:hypothetical protein